MRLLVSLALFSALAAAQDSRPATLPASRPALLEERVDAVLQPFLGEQRIVGLSVALIVDGQPALTRHYGFEDREKSIPSGPETRYRWASISKPVTAVAALRLREQGKLDLDQDVRKLVPEFPEKPWPITPRQLLCHQGGIVHYTNGKIVKREAKYDGPHPFADVVLALDTFCESPLVCEPGTRTSYSTHGYMLLGAVVQRAAGRSYWECVRDVVAAPLRMTTFRPDYPWQEIPHRAVGYRKATDGAALTSTDTDVSWKLPGGGFVSTIGDLARFGAGLTRREILEPATYELAWTKVPGKDGSAGGYGLGFAIGRFGEERQVSHSGSQEKTSTLLVLVPGKRIGVALMSNSEGVEWKDLAKRLLTLL